MSATVEIKFQCGGCDATHDAGRHLVLRKFRGIDGRDYGFGSWHWDTPNPADLYPEDWTKDPHTSADYCPKCAAEIWPESDQEGSGQGGEGCGGSGKVSVQTSAPTTASEFCPGCTHPDCPNRGDDDA